MQEVFKMLNRDVNQGKRPGPLSLASLFAAVAMMIAGIALPASAQDVESFDPDDAFTSTAPQTDPNFGAPETVSRLPDVAAPALPDAAASAGEQAEAIIRQPGFRTAPALDPVTGRTAPENSPSVPDASAGDFSEEFPAYDSAQAAPSDGPGWAASNPQIAKAPVQSPAAQEATTYGQDDLIGAAEGVFGKGAAGLAKMIENLLSDQGRPNGYIVGREAGGAFVLGARYGSGTLHHKIEGTRKVYWTGPSVGLDVGANAANTFVLVYNLFDTEDLFRRYGAGEGQAYLIGGLHASYMRRGDVVLIPIRMGAGLRLGVNAGYMKFSKKQRWLPF